MAEVRAWVARHFRVLLICSLLGLSVGVTVALVRPTYFRASTTLLLSSGSSADLAQLRGLASQFGLAGALGAGKDEFPPELVAQLARSSYVLLPIVQESLRVVPAEVKGRTLVELLRARPRGYSGASEEDRRAIDAVRLLAKATTIGVDRKTRAISLGVRSRWPELSVAVVARITASLDSVVFDVSRQRAQSERRAAGLLISQQEGRLRAAEASMVAFVNRNRSYAQSPELTFEYERLQREVTLQQQVLLSLTQAREQAQVKEMQMAPSLTVIEPPVRPVVPEPRKRPMIAMLGLLAGLLIGVVVARLWDLRRQ